MVKFILDGLDTIGVSIDQSQFIDMFTKRSIDFIKKNKNKSFFLYLAHTAPHTPLVSGKTQKGRSIRGAYGDVVEELDHSVGTILHCWYICFIFSSHFCQFNGVMTSNSYYFIANNFSGFNNVFIFLSQMATIGVYFFC